MCDPNGTSLNGVLTMARRAAATRKKADAAHKKGPDRKVRAEGLLAQAMTGGSDGAGLAGAVPLHQAW